MDRTRTDIHNHTGTRAEASQQAATGEVVEEHDPSAPPDLSHEHREQPEIAKRLASSVSHVRDGHSVQIESGASRIETGIPDI